MPDRLVRGEGIAWGGAVVRCIIAFALVLVSTLARASEVSAIPQIVDADTINADNVKIRLLGIDAPEMEQICLDAQGKPWRCGLEARNALNRRAGGHLWTCRPSGSDRYGRTLASCSVDGEDISSWLVRNGWALAFRRYSVTYIADEDFARQSEKGLWHGSFIAPWEWRHRSAKTTILGAKMVSVEASRILGATAVGTPPAPDCLIKGNLRSSSTCIYHVPGGHFYDRLNMTNSAARRWFCSEAEAQAAGCRRSKL